MNVQGDFPEISIRAAYGDRDVWFKISFNRYGGGNYQVQKAGDKPGQYWYYGNCWFADGRWICTHGEFTADDADAIGQAIEKIYGIEKARKPLDFLV